MCPEGLEPQRGPTPKRAFNQPPYPNRSPLPPPTQTWEPIDDRLRPKLEAPLTKRQLKCSQNKDSKLAKQFTRLEADIDI